MTSEGISILLIRIPHRAAKLEFELQIFVQKTSVELMLYQLQFLNRYFITQARHRLKYSKVLLTNNIEDETDPKVN